MEKTVAQRLLEADLQSADFRIGAAKGRWGLVKEVSEIDWPYVWMWVQAADRTNSPDRLIIRWDFSSYKANSPTGGFWDDTSNDFLAKGKWPKGKPGTAVAMVFRADSWALAGKCFYHPYDRKAMEGHYQWPQQYPQWIWTEKKSITDFLDLIHHWLNCGDYLGC